MSFDATKMHCLFSNGDQSLYLYNTADAAATVAADGYFDSAIDDEQVPLREKDLVIAVTSTGVSASMDVDVYVVQNALDESGDGDVTVAALS